MADTITRADSIESSGFPLGFKVRQGRGRSGVIGASAARDSFRVELRAMGGHQKECVVTEGATGSAFRLVSDEGAGLKGTDLAPFPLGVFSAGLQADIQNRIMALARAHGIGIDALATELVNVYEFNGSFFRGDGKGSAEAPRVRVRATTAASHAAIEGIVRAAFDASPMVALVRGTPANTFALYNNGRRRTVQRPLPSTAPDAPDPLKTWKGVPSPLVGANDLPGMISKLVPAPESSATNWVPAGQPVDPTATIRRSIEIRGESLWNAGTTESETWATRPLGSRFGLKSDERSDADQAPSGLAIAMSGIGFCLMTQLLRYTEVHKMKIRGLRLVQDSPFELVGSGRDLRAVMHPIDTHVFVNGDDTDERMEQLLVMAQNTCYLHALLHDPFDPILEIEMSGAKKAA